MGRAELAGHAHRLRRVVIERGDARLRAGFTGRADRRARGGAAVGEERGRDLHDLGRGPVVASELHDASAREVTGEGGEQVGVRAGEPVDRLIRVTDDAEIGPVAQPRAHEAELRGAGVLELVDEEVPEPPPLHRAELGVLLESVGTPPDQVVEVEDAAATLLVLVAVVDLGDLVRGARRLAMCLGGRGRVAVGADEPRLRPFDLGRDLTRGERRLWPPTTDEGEEEPDLALDDARHRAPAFLAPSAQLRERDRVEGSRRDAPVDAEPCQTRAQLAGRLARERDREDVFGIDRVLARAIRDAARRARASCPSRRRRGWRAATRRW